MKQSILRLAVLAAVMTPLPVLAQDAKPAEGTMPCPFLDDKIVGNEVCIGEAYTAVGAVEKSSQKADDLDIKAVWWPVNGKVTKLVDELSTGKGVTTEMRAAGMELLNIMKTILLKEKAPETVAKPAVQDSFAPIPQSKPSDDDFFSSEPGQDDFSPPQMSRPKVRKAPVYDDGF